MFDISDQTLERLKRSKFEAFLGLDAVKFRVVAKPKDSSNKWRKALQVNFHHGRGASGALSHYINSENIAVAVIHEPWLIQGRVTGLGETKGKLLYDRNRDNPRACIFVREDVTTLLLLKYFLRTKRPYN